MRGPGRLLVIAALLGALAAGASPAFAADLVVQSVNTSEFPSVELRVALPPEMVVDGAVPRFELSENGVDRAITSAIRKAVSYVSPSTSCCSSTPAAAWQASRSQPRRLPRASSSRLWGHRTESLWSRSARTCRCHVLHCRSYCAGPRHRLGGGQGRDRTLRLACPSGFTDRPVHSAAALRRSALRRRGHCQLRLARQGCEPGEGRERAG